MIVVGGTYAEYCSWPARDTVMGSGMRAAAALSHVDPGITLISAIESEGRDVADFVAAGLGVRPVWTNRSGPVRFHYTTPLSTPVAYGRSERADGTLEAHGDAVLAFGMLEGSFSARARRLVVDPQDPCDLRALPLHAAKADHLAVVLNRGEASRLTGEVQVETAARRIVDSSRADVVVVKMGAAGALVTTPDQQVVVGVHPTHSVYPIGTGDVFAAGFSWAWASQGQTALEAAQTGSRLAATWASTETLPIPRELVGIGDALQPPLSGATPQVYLAGPYFSLPQRWLIDLARATLDGLGARCFSPFHDIGPGSLEVVKADLDAIASSQGMLAMCDEYDPGTMFEIGWAVEHGLPVVVFLSAADSEKSKMMLGSGVEVHEDLSTAVYRSIWRAMGASAAP